MASTVRDFTDDQLRRLLEIGRALVSELDTETLLAQLLEVARDLTGAKYAALGVLDERKSELKRFVALGIDDASRDRIGPLPRGRGVLGELIRHPRPLRLPDVEKHPRSFGFPPGHPPMHSFLGVPILIRGEAWGNLYLAEKTDGEEFSEDDERVTIVLSEWASVAIQNARLYERLEHRGQELERAVRGLEASTDMARAVAVSMPSDRLMELVVKRGRDLIDARLVLLMVRDGGDVVVTAAGGEAPHALIGHRIPISEPWMVQALAARGAYRFGRRELGSFDVDRLGVVAEWLIVAPLEFRGRPPGLLAALDRMDGEEFAVDDELLFGSFAASVATTLDMARMVEKEKLELSLHASEQERRRWARELHDETLQELGGLRFMLEAAGQTGDPVKATDAAAKAVEYADRAIDNLEGLITELRPSSLDALGVGPAVEALVERLGSNFQVEIDASVDLERDEAGGESRLAPELEAGLYRIVQEGLNNAVRHADASRIELRVTERGMNVVVSIRDDGRGFEPDDVQGGFGLVGMRERVTLANGSIEIKSAPGQGSRIEVELPIDRRDP